MIDLLLLILALIILIVGIIGCVLPVVPGPPLSFVGMLLVHYTRYAFFDTSTLILFGLVAIFVQILDYVVPVWGTKKFGGSKYGSWGSIIGLIVGLFFVPAIGPFGIITILAGPFFGALIGEKMGGADSTKALKAAFGSFIGFLTGTFLKMVTSLTITGFVIYNLFKTNF